MSYSFKVSLSEELPPDPIFDPQYRRAPSRGYNLNKKDTLIAIKNALRYIPTQHHEFMSKEFLQELRQHGRIYGYRYRPQGGIIAKSIDDYTGITEARAIQLMIDNNVSFDICLYPYELVTYGSTGQVCQNWMQFILIKKYLKIMTEEQTLVVSSGHPVGLFNTYRNAPRVISTNGLMVGMFDTLDDFHRVSAMGVSNYGQMTAGGWMYIGPQGIVHGTYITLLNAGRKYLGLGDEEDLAGVLYVTSGLGGMSGAQPKAAVIAGAISVTAEVDYSQIKTRHEQGWVERESADLNQIFDWVNESRVSKRAVSIAYHGNVVDLLQFIVDNNLKAELISDQTSCHAVYEGGYTPVSLTHNEAKKLIETEFNQFKKQVDESLLIHFDLIKTLVQRGSHFYDYGNSFMKAIFDAGGTSIAKNGVNTLDGFIFPSYVEDIMGPLCFDYGYGPFRWVCLSGKDADLKKTDEASMSCIDPERRGQDRDNYIWIRDAGKNNLVVGSKARILYADGEGRVKIALKFNEMVRNKEVGPIMMGRDHHDTGGTDSPFRETSNIYDGSNITSDMAHLSWAGNVSRGMTMAVLSNGGGVGTGKAINGGFGLVLDGSGRVDEIIKSALDWDVIIGVGRRSWAGNKPSIDVTKMWNDENKGHITLPETVDDKLDIFLDSILD